MADLQRGSFYNPVMDQDRMREYADRISAVQERMQKFIASEESAGLAVADRLSLRNAARMAAFEQLLFGVHGGTPPVQEPSPLNQCQLEELFLERLEDLFNELGMPGFGEHAGEDVGTVMVPEEQPEAESAVKVRRKKTRRHVEGAEEQRSRPLVLGVDKSRPHPAIDDKDFMSLAAYAGYYNSTWLYKIEPDNPMLFDYGNTVFGDHEGQLWPSLNNATMTPDHHAPETCVPIGTVISPVLQDGSAVFVLGLHRMLSADVLRLHCQGTIGVGEMVIVLLNDGNCWRKSASANTELVNASVWGWAMDKGHESKVRVLPFALLPRRNNPVRMLDIHDQKVATREPTYGGMAITWLNDELRTDVRTRPSKLATGGIVKTSRWHKI